MASIACFFLEPIDRATRYLRRYERYENPPGSTCPVPGHAYHNARVHLDIVPAERDEKGHWKEPSGDLWPHDDPRWPVTCEACGARFKETDHYQLFVSHLFRRTDTGKEMTIDDAPPGAMWYADWYLPVNTWDGTIGKFVGPDGHCLAVKTPAGDWLVDGPASNGPGWMREGVPPNVTARPSIGVGEPMRYHGFLTNGVLTDA